MIQVTWTGAAGLRFERDGEIVLIDPYHTRVTIFSTLFRRISPDEEAIRAQLPAMEGIRAVIVSHTHSDHALDVPYIASHSNARVVGSASLDTLMGLHGMAQRGTVCQGGETIPLTSGAAVTMLRSDHGLIANGRAPFPGEIRPASTLPMRAREYRVGAVFAPKLEMGGLTFLHVGSANFIEEAITGHTCDVLFLCVPGWKKRAGYPERLIELTHPRQVVLFHYDNFSRPHRPGARTRRIPFVDIRGMMETIRTHSPGIEIVVPEVYATLRF